MFKRYNYVFHWVHWLVLSLSLLLTVTAWYAAQSQFKTTEKVAFEKDTEHVLELLKERLKEYESALLGSVAALNSRSEEFDYYSWKSFAKSLDLQGRYPGVNGIGIIFKVPLKDKETFIKKMRLERSFFDIFPTHLETELFPITYLEPDEKNMKAVGLDIAHEKNRYQAAKLAEKTGLPQITAPIILVQDAKKTPGFLFYYPFYVKGTFKGLVYAPFIFKNLILGTLREESRRISMKISDGESILYEEDLDEHLSTLHKRKTLDLYGRKWNVDLWPKVGKTTGFTEPQIILISGILIDLLLLFLFMSISRTKEKAVRLADKLTEELKIKINDLEIQISKKHTARKQAQRAAKLASIGELSAGMAHEINNPLAIITGYLDILKMKLSREKNNKFTSEIEKATDAAYRIKKIIDNLRKLSRDDSDAEAKKVNIEDIIKESSEILETKFKSDSIEFSIDYKAKFDILVNEVEIVQVIMNLLSNAAQAINGQDNPWIKIICETHEQNAVIKIVDSGLGIDSSVSDKMFDPFFTTKEVGEGTGLGLSISRGIIQNNNGTLDLMKDVPNTTFEIIFPIA